MATIISERWYCPTCTYEQDFRPTEETTAEFFNNDHAFRVRDLGISECPGCALQGIRGNLLSPK